MFVLIGASLLVAVVFLLLFIFASRSGQFDDSYTPSVRMLFDNPPNPPAEKDKASEKL
jgi:cbb3-type cytochrome oxidase maturation protein